MLVIESLILYKYVLDSVKTVFFLLQNKEVVALKLNARQKAFCEYYVASGNATESARKAGYSEKTANRIASENLSKLDIKKYIEELNKKAKDSRIMSMLEIKEFWSEAIKNSDNKMTDRLKASELLAKTNGAFLEKVEVSGEIKNKNPFAELTTEELKRLANG